eukprot:SAG22_NODE_2423_length_2590_cov_1.917302_1_plen_510_part_00
MDRHGSCVRRRVALAMHRSAAQNDDAGMMPLRVGGAGGPIMMLLLAAAAAVSTAANTTAAAAAAGRRVRWFTDADQVEANWAFALAHRDAATGFYPCCQALGATGGGGLELLAAEDVAQNISGYGRAGFTAHPVVALNEPATLAVAAAPNSTFAADAARLCEQYNFSGLAFDYEAAGDYRVYAELLSHVSAALHALRPRREVVVCVDTSNIFNDSAAFAAIQAAGVDVQLSMSTYKWEDPLHERKYVEVLTAEGVPAGQISAGVLSCGTNYSNGCKQRGSAGDQGDWTAARLERALAYLERTGVPELAVWPAAPAFLDVADFYFPALRSFLRVKTEDDDHDEQQAPPPSEPPPPALGPDRIYRSAGFIELQQRRQQHAAAAVARYPPAVCTVSPNGTVDVSKCAGGFDPKNATLALRAALAAEGATHVTIPNMGAGRPWLAAAIPGYDSSPNNYSPCPLKPGSGGHCPALYIFNRTRLTVTFEAGAVLAAIPGRCVRPWDLGRGDTVIS